MKNLTLRIDDHVLAEARKQASLKGTTVAQAVREFLIRFAGGDAESEKSRRARLELAEMARASSADFGPGWKWRREDAYEGPRFSRLERIALRGQRKPGGKGKAAPGDRAD